MELADFFAIDRLSQHDEEMLIESAMQMQQMMMLYESGIREIKTKLDILSGLKKIRMCVAYDIDGVRYDYIPSSMEELQRAKPIYEEFDGWQEDISTMKTYEELPENCKIYLRRIEDLCNTRISMISVGQERNCNIYLHEMLK